MDRTTTLRQASSRPAVTRRETLRRIGAGATAVALAAGGWQRSARAVGEADAGVPLAGAELPPDIGQAATQVYVEATGHTVRGVFLDYWRANGASTVYGNPISEPFVTDDSYYSQAFETAVFQYRPEYLCTEDPIVRLMPIGRTALDAFGASSAQLDPRSDAVARVLDTGGFFDEVTGHTISGDILTWYRFNEGTHYLGRPLSEPIADGSAAIQYFEGAIVRRGPEGVALALLASDLAWWLGIDTAPVDQGDLPSFDELLFWTADQPDLRGDPYSPGAKWLEVGIGEQRLWAYHGQTLIATTLISTGIAPNDTDLGMFRVRLKYPAQDMRGFTDETGEVIGVGEAPEGTIPYEVPDVPHVMYFNLEAEALHGAYWHDSFGQRMSHGCVNLPPAFAAWLYGWAPLGTGVWVRA